MNYGLVNQPKSGATLRVWQVADEITRETGRLARRKEVIERVASEGGNQNTASTQYYYWKAAQEEGTRDDLGDAGPGPGAVTRVSVAKDGTLRLPPHILSALRIPDGGTLAARLEDGELRLAEPLVALRRVQKMLRPLREKLAAEGVSLSDELIADRRSDAARGSQ